MAFKSNIAPKVASKAPAKKKPGGRFSGIAPRAERIPTIKAGEYVLEFVETTQNRKASCLILDVIVVYSEGEGASPPDPATKLRGFINYGDIANQTFVSLAMALCECDTVEALEEAEPDYDELIDAICCKPSAQSFRKPGENDPAFGVNPTAGMRVYARVWASTTIANGGEPFRNFEFGICPDEYKKAEEE